MKPYNEWGNDRYKRLIIDHTIDEASFLFSLEAYKGGMAEALRWVLDHNIESSLRKIIDAKLAELEDKP